MKEYPDPKLHFQKHVRRVAEGLQQSGLEATPTLIKAIAERTRIEAKEMYMQEADEILHHNLGQIMENHKRRMNQIKREGARLRMWTCPPIAFLFGLMAWYSFGNPDGMIAGVIYAVGSLAFLAMLVLGAIFDRPTR